MTTKDEALSRICFAAARVSDRAAVARLFAPINTPSSKALLSQVKLGKKGTAPCYDPASRTAYFLGTDGEEVVCWSISPVPLKAAALIWEQLTKLTEWSSESVHAAIQAVDEGGTIVRVQ